MHAAMFVLCRSLAVFAEDTNSNANRLPQIGDEALKARPLKCRKALS